MPYNAVRGSSVGNNLNNGHIFLDSISPQQNFIISNGDYINFTIGSDVGIDLQSIKITISNEIVFDGISFSYKYSSFSSYLANISVSGYDFSIKRSGDFRQRILIRIEARTINGGSFLYLHSLLLSTPAQYPVIQYGEPSSSVKSYEFSGEFTGGLMSGANGQIFFSPGIENANQLVELDVDDIELRTYTSEKYEIQQTNNARPFVWGPPYAVPPVSYPEFPPLVTISYLPVLNDSGFGFLKNTYDNVNGILHDTILNTDTIILY